MKTLPIFILLIFISTFLFGQSETNKYDILISQADSLYKIKDYKSSALKFSEAFKSNGWKALPADRYNASCSWSLANNPDSAFFQLTKIATKADYKNYDHIISDPDFNNLHSDKRWKSLLKIIKKNKEKSEANINKPLAAKLDSIYAEDQNYRLQIDEIEKKFGGQSVEMKAHWKLINKKDSLNVVQIKSIIDKYGWLGADVVGVKGNSTIFLVIQHADLKTQEKYLPVMRKAAKKGNARGSSLALLEDRIAIKQGKKQIYGSQIGQDYKTNTYYVSPLEDPDNVDKRRAQVGLEPLANYVNRFKIKWDVEQYKKDLPELVEKVKNIKFN